MLPLPAHKSYPQTLPHISPRNPPPTEGTGKDLSGKGSKKNSIQNTINKSTRAGSQLKNQDGKKANKGPSEGKDYKKYLTTEEKKIAVEVFYRHGGIQSCTQISDILCQEFNFSMLPEMVREIMISGKLRDKGDGFNPVTGKGVMRMSQWYTLLGYLKFMTVVESRRFDVENAFEVLGGSSDTTKPVSKADFTASTLAMGVNIAHRIDEICSDPNGLSASDFSQLVQDNQMKERKVGKPLPPSFVPSLFVPISIDGNHKCERKDPKSPLRTDGLGATMASNDSFATAGLGATMRSNFSFGTFGLGTTLGATIRPDDQALNSELPDTDLSPLPSPRATDASGLMDIFKEVTSSPSFRKLVDRDSQQDLRSKNRTCPSQKTLLSHCTQRLKTIYSVVGEHGNSSNPSPRALESYLTEASPTYWKQLMRQSPRVERGGISEVARLSEELARAQRCLEELRDQRVSLLPQLKSPRYERLNRKDPQDVMTSHS